jgi:hypothetical protein
MMDKKDLRIIHPYHYYLRINIEFSYAYFRDVKNSKTNAFHGREW